MLHVTAPSNMTSFGECAALMMTPTPSTSIRPRGCAVSRRYVPSAWEQQWAANISALAVGRVWRQACRQLVSERDSVSAWLDTCVARTEGVANGAWSHEIFSYHELRGCDGRAVVIPIEPLVGLLRHPNYYCIVPGTGSTHIPNWVSGALWQFNRDYLLPMWKVEAQLASPGRAYFFDLGASVYNGGLGGASQKWFIDSYLRRGIHFDRIFAWEVRARTDEQIMKPLPKALRNRTTVYREAPAGGFRLPDEQLSYFNFGVSSDPSDPRHPWRLLRATAKLRDLVVVKVDIDSPSIEEPLVRQILEDDALSGLIDDFYFEHHVHNHPLTRRNFGWGPSVQQTNCTVVDSYEVFARLRQLGIRAHSWV